MLIISNDLYGILMQAIIVDIIAINNIITIPIMN